ncbi:MAG: formate/nitrite transporter family protein [Desulfuromonadaceae bacterium]|nr:formate/nitrite transporter family protein [Desulfuromonadaceae bacterium]
MKNFLTPAELAEQVVSWGHAKVRSPVQTTLLLGVLAGAYIGFAAHLATIVATGDFTWIGLKQFSVGAVFSLGLMLVIIPGSELWTGNTLMSAALLERRITLGQMLRNWCWVYLGNLAGAVFLAWMIASQTGILDGAFGVKAVQIAAAKVEQSSGHNLAYFYRALACNWLVCLAIMQAMAAQDIAGKVLAIFFPIMAFVASGFEHAIANMYFIPAGIFAAQLETVQSMCDLDPALLEQLNWATMWQNNLISVTLGNLVGGGLCVGVCYWWIYRVRYSDGSGR